jgi:hypothetical protein
MNETLPIPNQMSLLRSTLVRQVFAALKRGPLIAAALAAPGETGSRSVQELVDGLVHRGAVRRHSSGQDAMYELLGLPEMILGVDLGGTKVHVALSDLSGEVLAEEMEPTDLRGGPHVVDQIGAIAERLRQQADRAGDPLRSAAVGSPGVLDPRSGKISISPNIPGIETVDLVDALEARLGCSVLIENDVNLGALGEMWHGSATGVGNFAFVALGTGIGMGLVMGGELLRGAHGAAGEIAFLPI